MTISEPRISETEALTALAARLERELGLVRTSLAYNKGAAATVRRAGMLAAQLVAVRSALGWC